MVARLSFPFGKFLTTKKEGEKEWGEDSAKKKPTAHNLSEPASSSCCCLHSRSRCSSCFCFASSSAALLLMMMMLSLLLSLLLLFLLLPLLSVWRCSAGSSENDRDQAVRDLRLERVSFSFSFSFSFGSGFVFGFQFQFRSGLGVLAVLRLTANTWPIVAPAPSRTLARDAAASAGDDRTMPVSRSSASPRDSHLEKSTKCKKNERHGSCVRV